MINFNMRVWENLIIARELKLIILLEINERFLLKESGKLSFRDYKAYVKEAIRKMSRYDIYGPFLGVKE